MATSSGAAGRQRGLGRQVAGTHDDVFSPPGARVRRRLGRLAVAPVVVRGLRRGRHALRRAVAGLVAARTVAVRQRRRVALRSRSPRSPRSRVRSPSRSVSPCRSRVDRRAWWRCSGSVAAGAAACWQRCVFFAFRCSVYGAAAARARAAGEAQRRARARARARRRRARARAAAAQACARAVVRAVAVRAAQRRAQRRARERMCGSGGAGAVAACGACGRCAARAAQAQGGAAVVR